MREIKYRGKMEGEWHYVNPWDVRPDANYDWEPFWSLMAIGQGDKETIGEYIGLKDKNRKEIYEDDILRDRWGILWKVQWNKEKAQFELAWCGGPQPEYYREGMHLIKDCQCEIIGNIHEEQ